MTDGVCVVARDELPSQATSAVLEGAVVAITRQAAIEITGPGAIPCLQGLVTADVDKPGDMSFLYGALLTAKGMIVSDMWIERRDPFLVLYMAQHRKDEVLTTLERSLPPRLAQFADRSDNVGIVRLTGPRTFDVVARAGLDTPQPGNVATVEHVTVARPALGYPFALQCVGDIGSIDQVRSSLTEAGAIETPYAALHLPRILAGWPFSGAEIDTKTLPQEVRFDDLNGVSHSKGCYLGQETVARLHFRGHTNRRILGLRFAGAPDPTMSSIAHEDRRVGRLTSVAWYGHNIGYLGLGMIRREIEIGRTVSAGGVSAVTESLPIEVGT
ncbi:MAG: hypothetical protein JSW51_03330 [Gemmatimonadota bacterium]|nr:MAG: hypothetical protein JSW51_03330 [Gemmatimonadota bacterium]